MTERTLRQKAAKMCKKYGFKYWFAPRVKFCTSQDIFNAFDMIILPYDKKPYFIQLTTFSHKESRRKKIAVLFKKYPLPERSYIWAYNNATRKFVEIKL